MLLILKQSRLPELKFWYAFLVFDLIEYPVLMLLLELHYAFRPPSFCTSFVMPI